MGIVGCAMDRVTAPVVFNDQVRPAMWRLGLRYDALRRGARAGPRSNELLISVGSPMRAMGKGIRK